MLVRTEDGAQFRFPSDGSGGFVGPAGSTDQLVTIAGGYELRRADQLRYQFNSTGRLLAEIDRNGNTLTFAYSGANLTTITDSVGRVITLAYDASGRRTSLADPAGRTVGYAYNAAGRLVGVTDVRAGLTAYAYDAAGRLATITDPNGHVLVTNTYGPTGRVTDQIDALGQHGTFGWDPASGTSTFTDHRGGIWTDVYAANRLVARSDPLGNTTTYSYDARFNRTSTTDPRGNTTTFTYDAAGNVLSVTAPPPLGHVTQFTYDAANNVLTSTDGRGFTTTNTYDASGNLRTVTGPGPTNPVTTFTVNATGQLSASSDPRGKTTTFTYDAQGNRASATSPLGERTTMSYDAAGRMTSVVEPRGNVSGANPADYTTTLTYDPAGHLLSTTDPLGNRTTTTYDPAGNRSSVTDANNRPTTYTYDAANRLVSVSDALAKVTTYTYDATGNLVGRTDPNGHVTGFAYDLAGRMTSTTDPLNQVTATTYDAAGNSATRTDANAKTTMFTYDALNRLTGITYAAPTTAPVTYAYDANGNRTALTDGAGTETFAYDSLNRLTSDTRGVDVFSYTYDQAGNRLSRTYPDGTLTTYAYDNDGRLGSATFPIGAPADTTPPSVPTGAATSASAWNSVTVSWTASTDAVGVTRYALYRGGALLVWLNGTTTSFLDHSTLGATAYSYTVVALDAAGNASAHSAVASVTTPAGSGSDTTPPSMPTGLAAVALSATRVDLSWSASTDGSGAPPPGAIARVGGAAKQASTAATTLPITYASSAGHLLVVMTGVPSATTVSSIADSAGNTWTKVSGASGSRTTYETGEMWYAKNAAPISSLTITFSGSTKSSAVLEEFANVDTSAPLDVSRVANGASTAPNSGPTTAVSANELVLGYTSYQSPLSTYTPTAGYTALANVATNATNNNTGTAAEWRLAAAGTQTDAPTLGTNSRWIDGVAVFKPAPPPGPSGVQGYKLYRNSVYIGTAVGTMSLADTALTASTAYTYTVSALDGAGNESAQSGTVGATTPAAPPTSGSATYGYDPAGELTTITTPDGITARRTYDRAGRLLEVSNTAAGGTLSRFTSTYPGSTEPDRLTT